MLKEISTNEELKSRTNAVGLVAFTITKEGKWHTFIEGFEYKSYVLKVNEGERSTNSFEITHNPAFNLRIREQVFDRKNFQVITMPPQAIGTKAGVALRFPRISRWRKDKKPDEINTLDDLKKMLEVYGKYVLY